MANINDVFGEYDESKPMVSFNLPSKEELIAELLGVIPGGRALKNFHDNPEGTASETLSLAAEDVVPFYGAIKNGADVEDILKEAVMLGVPMPYIKHPVTGKPIPNNLREAVTPKAWYNMKHNWSHNKPGAKKLYYSLDNIRYMANPNEYKEGLATTHRVNRNQIAIPAEQVFGPHKHTNTGANVQNTGKQARTQPLNPDRHLNNGKFSGVYGWQGEMYPPGRSLRKDDFVGPQQWEDKYSRKLDAALDENEYKWEYLINKTRPQIDTHGRTVKVLPKEDLIDIALKQGRPDLAERIVLDNKPRIASNQDAKFNSYRANQRKLTNEEWKDIGNRQIEKELRETFASLPNDPDIRYRFAEHYGVPDLYQSWLNDPLPWEKIKAETANKRYFREHSNRRYDRRTGNTIQR